MGLELPPELREALSWVGVRWPEADETALFRCGEYWGAFAEQAATHAETAAAAVAAMLEENEGEGLDAFAAYWQKVAGRDGYVADCGIVAGATSVAFYSAGGLVLSLKLLVIAQLVAFAVLLVAAIAAAIETLGASLAAAAEIAVVVNRTITTFVTATITAIQQLGVPLSQLAADHLGKQIARLAGRPIHASPARVDDFKTPEERAQDAQQPPAVDPTVPGPAGTVLLRPPHDRHHLNRIKPNSRPANENTIILPQVRDAVSQDLADIQRGRAKWDAAANRYVTDSGRRYGLESNGTVYPVDGPGFEQLNRAEYKALRTLIEHAGDRQAAEASTALDPSITTKDFDRAGEVYRHYGK